MRSYFLAALAITVLAKPARAEFQLVCPAPDTIQRQTIPHSVNSIYTGESEGVGFWGLSAGLFESPPFAAAELSEVNGYHSFACVYQQNTASLPLVTNTSPVYGTCRFAGGQTTCRGTRSQCAVSCASKPPVQEAAALQQAADGFLNILNEANRIVVRDYPGAYLLEATKDLTRFGSPWRFVFGVPASGSDKTDTTVFLNYAGNQFQLPPTHVGFPWGGSKPIPLPVPMGLMQAVELARQAGYTAPIAWNTLRWPLMDTELLYSFAMPAMHVHVFVGVYTHKVTTSPLTR